MDPVKQKEKYDKYGSNKEAEVGPLELVPENHTPQQMPTEPAQPLQPAQPVKPAQPSQPAQPTRPVQINAKEWTVFRRKKNKGPMVEEVNEEELMPTTDITHNYGQVTIYGTSPHG